MIEFDFFKHNTVFLGKTCGIVSYTSPVLGSEESELIYVCWKYLILYVMGK